MPSKVAVYGLASNVSVKQFLFKRLQSEHTVLLQSQTFFQSKNLSSQMNKYTAFVLPSLMRLWEKKKK